MFWKFFCTILIALICHKIGANAQTTTNRYHSYRGVVNRTNSMVRTDGYEKIYEKIANIEEQGEQQLRKLEEIDEKLTNFDSTNALRFDQIFDDMKNVALVRSTTDGAITNLDEHFKATICNTETSADKISSLQDDHSTSDKFESLAVLLVATKAEVLNAQHTLNELATNMSTLMQISRDIQQRQIGLPTKQYLNSALHGIKTNSIFNSPNPIGQTFSSFDNSAASSEIANNCWEYKEFGMEKSGIQKIQVKSFGKMEQFYVWCEMESQDGGWTVIQNRKDGTINFNRNWLEYKNGFGNLAGEFFIGLDKLHAMTSNSLNELLIEMEDFDGERRYANYNMFAIAGEVEYYALNLIGNYEGTAGDSLSYSASHKFSTFDNDNDGWVEGNCAQAHTGAWWYNACEMANLNGKYLKGNTTLQNLYQGMYWNEFHGPNYSLRSVRMLIRPIDRL